jgi:hypothetical protein
MYSENGGDVHLKNLSETRGDFQRYIDERALEKSHADRLREAEALAKRDIARHGENSDNERPLKDFSQDEKDKIEADVAAQIDDLMRNSTRSSTIFDPYYGYVTQEDMQQSDTHASLKDVIKALKTGAEQPDEIYDDAERLLYKYSIFVREGIRETIAGHKNVSWYLVDKAEFNQREERALISFQDGPNADWNRDCLADEVPLWLLQALFRRIARRKPLGDQQADETIQHVKEFDAAYGAELDRQELEKNLGRLNISRHSSLLRSDDSDQEVP